MAEQRDGQIGVKRSPFGLCELIIHSDSQWCMNLLNRLWKAMCNLDLIDAIRRYAHNHSVRPRWIPREASLADCLA